MRVEFLRNKVVELASVKVESSGGGARHDLARGRDVDAAVDLVEGFEFGPGAEAAWDNEGVLAPVAEGVEDGTDVGAFEVGWGMGRGHDGEGACRTSSNATAYRGIDEKEVGSVEVLRIIETGA